MKWLRRNGRFRSDLATKSSRHAVKAMVLEGFPARLNGIATSQFRTYLDEPINTPTFPLHLHDEEEHFCSLSIESADLFANKTLIQYATVCTLNRASSWPGQWRCLPLSPVLQRALHRASPYFGKTGVDTRRR